MPVDRPPRSTRSRLALLVALAAAGWLAGTAVSGNAYWYCAIPAAVALGWFFVADPTQCEPDRGAARDGRAPTNGPDP